MKNQEGINWCLDQLNKQAGRQMWTHLLTKGKFQIKTSKVEGLMSVFESKLPVDAMELELSLWFEQSSDVEDYNYNKEPHCIMRKRYHVMGNQNPDDFYDQFYEDIFHWMIHGKSIGDFKNCSDLIRNGLDCYKDLK